MKATLRVDDISAGYGRVLAVKNLSLSAAAGEVVSILGRNGAGKTTTLLSVSGLVKPRSGRVSVDGTSLRLGRPHAASKAGLIQVPEDRALFTGLTVRENLAAAGARRKADLTMVTDLFPELEPLIGRRAGLLSGGEQQMLALARAITLRPKVLLVDEMSLGLAPVVCQRLSSVIRGLADESGVAVLLVEQHLSLALEVADRGIVLHKGSVAMEGTRAELTAKRHEIESSYMGGAGTVEDPAA
ncbi:ABC transporter ATP-binding protein [Actinomadura rugatobispora]|uniref:ABC transporter ATP-binding protein n=1 Tax=Actinomadura rugatobispora TaxID=1994 RepID=A0ABW0ZV76_9ACTN|nr:ABC transporter ATP-binding protein [Actinomadura rugatobispora]